MFTHIDFHLAWMRTLLTKYDNLKWFSHFSHILSVASHLSYRYIVRAFFTKNIWTILKIYAIQYHIILGLSLNTILQFGVHI